MWLMTNRGFYSIVEKEWDRTDGTLTVRARTLEDIERFIEMCPTSPIDTVLVESRPDHCAEESTQSAFIEEDERADYRWRIRIDREEVGRVMLAHIGNIDYENFKNSVADNGLTEHAACYAKVWGDMMRLQQGGLYNT